MKNMNSAKTSGFLSLMLVCVTLLVSSGCSHTKYSPNPPDNSATPEKITLQEGDGVKVVFPDASNLNTTAKVRRDGTITMPVIGEIRVAGMTSAQLEKALLAKYADQIVTKEISVSIDSSSYLIYVTGAVRNPGKITSDRPLTALEAILEAGGVDYSRANLKGVVVSRNINGRLEHFKVDIKSVMTGRSNQNFNLRPNDILFVPEKFAWF